MVPTLCLFLSSFLLVVAGGFSGGGAYQSSVIYPAYSYVTYTCPICPPPPPPPPEADPEIEDVLEFTKKISDTVCQVGSTLTEIGQIALDDNPEVGAEIVKKLQTEVSKGAKVLGDYATKTSGGQVQLPDGGVVGGRTKRAAKKEGAAALDKVGDVLANSNSKIDTDKKKLSQKAQNKINKKHKDGLDKCGADSCKAAAKLLAGADDAEDERE